MVGGECAMHGPYQLSLTQRHSKLVFSLSQSNYALMAKKVFEL